MVNKTYKSNKPKIKKDKCKFCKEVIELRPAFFQRKICCPKCYDIKTERYNSGHSSKMCFINRLVLKGVIGTSQAEYKLKQLGVIN